MHIPESETKPSEHVLEGEFNTHSKIERTPTIS